VSGCDILRKRQQNLMADDDCIASRTGSKMAVNIVAPRHRQILINWLLEVKIEFKTSDEAIIHTIQLFDKISFKVSIEKEKIQLYAVACYFVCAKFDDIHPPIVGDLVWICDDAYTREELLSTEVKVLELLNHQVITHSPFSFCSESDFFATEKGFICYILFRYWHELSNGEALQKNIYNVYRSHRLKSQHPKFTCAMHNDKIFKEFIDILYKI
jgi:hypothetical protein